MCLCSAGNEGGATLPRAKKYHRNAVKRVSCKQTPCFGLAARWSLFAIEIAPTDRRAGIYS